MLCVNAIGPMLSGYFERKAYILLCCLVKIAIYILQHMTDYYQIHAVSYASSNMLPYMNTTLKLIGDSFRNENDSPKERIKSYRYSSNMLESVDIEGSIYTSTQKDFFYYNDSSGEITNKFVR